MEIYEKLIKPVLQNQVATGLSFTAVFGMVVYQFRQIPERLKILVGRTFVMKLRVMSSDDAFKWVDLWLSKQLVGRHIPSVVLKADTNTDGFDDSDGPKKYVLAPGAGLNWFWWKGRFFWIEREIGDGPAAATGHQRKAGPPLETLWIYTLGRSQDLIRDMVEEVKTAIDQTDLTPIYLWRGSYWAKLAGKKLRSLATVVLQDGIQEAFIRDIDHFFESRPYYEERGIPWRRGYLVSGPPGTGKTSFVLALAAHFKRTICVLNLGSVRSDDMLFSAMLDAPKDALILIEDIDCAESSHVRKSMSSDSEVPLDEAGEDSKITKAGLLNALDGVTTPDGRILIMTTNFPEKLDPALVRPGRADVHYIFDYLGPSEQGRLAELYYGKGIFNPLSYKISPAEMQKAFMLHPNNPNQAREVLLDASQHV